MMEGVNSGAYLVDSRPFDIDALVSLYRESKSLDWFPVLADLPYAKKVPWYEVRLITRGEKTENFARFPYLEQIEKFFQCEIQEMMFYSLLPGAELHPHRDMTGAVGLGGLRFHIPLITNPEVDFQVSRRRVPMKTGELWALDTSYLHSVANRGAEERVHLVIEVKLNDWCRSRLPAKDHRYYLHQVALIALAGHRAMKTLLTDPQRLKGNLNVARNVVRMLKTKIVKPSKPRES